MHREMNLAVAGNVSREPELRHNKNSGKPFAALGVAVNDRYFDQEKQQWVDGDATFYDVVCGGALGANVLASIKHGMPVIVYGRFKMREWATDTARGSVPQIYAESIGVDLQFGTTSYFRGTQAYPHAGDGYDAGPPPAFVREQVQGERGDLVSVVGAVPAPPEADDLAAHADANGELSEEGVRVAQRKAAEAAAAQAPATGTTAEETAATAGRPADRSRPSEKKVA